MPRPPQRCTSSVRCMLMALFLSALFLAACQDSGADSDDDPCLHVDCGEGTCTLLDGSPSCRCHDGYVTDGLACIPDPCANAPCIYGLCRVIGKDWACMCDAGYDGATCDRCAPGYVASGNVCVPGDPCEESPCVFGRCAVLGGFIHCSCYTGYDGERCDRCIEDWHASGLACVPDSDCSSNPCVHGDCRPLEDTVACDCHQGYGGQWCDRCADGYLQQGLNCVQDGTVDGDDDDPTGDPCDPNPCTESHRGQCLDMGGEAVCSCDSGYLWDALSESCVEDNQPDPCADDPCLEPNRGVCLAEAGGYECLCDEGYLEGDGGECVEDSSDIPTRLCGVKVHYRSDSAGRIYIRGEFNGWGLTDPLEEDGNLWTLHIEDLTPGDYAYKLYNEQSGQWFLDPNNPFTKYVGGEPNSRLRVPDCDHPLLELDSEPVVGTDSISFSVAASYSRGRYTLDQSGARVWRNGKEYEGAAFDPQSGLFKVADTGLEPGKYSYLFEIEDGNGKLSKRLFVPVWVEERPFNWQDAILYFVMTDRFKDGDVQNNDPVSDPELDWKANWQGGDFAGVLQKIEDDYFADLGVNTIWISSPIMNTEGAFWGSDNHKYSGYHSYWPVSTGWTEDLQLQGVEAIDPHFGSLVEFKQLVQRAHEKGIRILVDFVANHVHRDSPIYEDHWQESEPWFHWNDGRQGEGYVCGWERPIACWFAEYLPDFEYKNLQVMKMVMDHAIWLVQETNVDGFRMDAVKHMVLDVSTTIRARLDEEIDTAGDIRFYMVGETFTGEDGQWDIKAYVGRDMLDGQFDFPMFWKALKTLVRGESNLFELESFMNGNDGSYGADAVMSTFLGNHDVARVISHASGDIGDLWGNGSKEQGWSNPPSEPESEDAYKSLQMAWTFLFTQVGIPLIYYGDEYGEPGAGDPDNRRMMQFGSDLNARQKATLAQVQKLGLLRNQHAALRTGKRSTKKIEQDYWAYTMKEDSDAALIILNRGASRSDSIKVDDVGLSGTLVDVLSGRTLTVSGGRIEVEMGSGMSAVYVKQ